MCAFGPRDEAFLSQNMPAWKLYGSIVSVVVGPADGAYWVLLHLVGRWCGEALSEGCDGLIHSCETFEGLKLCFALVL